MAKIAQLVSVSLLYYVFVQMPYCIVIHSHTDSKTNLPFRQILLLTTKLSIWFMKCVSTETATMLAFAVVIPVSVTTFDANFLNHTTIQSMYHAMKVVQ